MIQNLTIDRFKSIRSLSLRCRKVNLFIGPPDTGKTNILEALYFLSLLGWGRSLDGFLRVRREVGFEPLFYRQFFDAPFRISLHSGPGRVDAQIADITIEVALVGHDRSLEVTPYIPESVLRPNGSIEPTVPHPQQTFRLGFGDVNQLPQLDWLRFYSYTSSEQWQYNTNFRHGTTVVTPPHGDNLIYIARHNANVYDFLKDTLSALNWKLRFDQNQKTFRLSEVREDEILDYNLDLLSDSLKRLFFYGAIIMTSENATLVMDEPDVFAFPPYPKTLGEMIGGDESNQFFLTTHNPYFLAGVVEKTPADKLALFVCSRDADGSTSAKLLTPEDVGRVIELGASTFFNLDEFLKS
jgi:hypothetical protein